MHVIFSFQEIEQLYKDVINLYVNMGAAQYLHDFRRDHHIKKCAELHNIVMQRQKKTKENSDSVSFQVWCCDLIYGKLPVNISFV